MESNCLKQEDQLEHLKKAFRNYKKSPKERITQSFIEARMDHLEKLYTVFFNQHTEIIAKITAEDKQRLLYFRNEMFDDFEDVYLEYKVKLMDDLKRILPTTSVASKQSNSTVTQPTTSSCEVRLPQINLPLFSGGYEDWQAYHDMFVSLIHENGNLSAVQKLHYLKSSLSGEPASLLKNLSTTENNYTEAWKQLITRYNNLRYNTNEIMKKLFTQRNILTESATGLKQLLDTTNSCLKSLNNLGIKIENWDVIINYLIVSKLDQESRKQWEVYVSQSDSDTLPTWSDLTKFLETRFRTLEMIAPHKQIIKQKSFHSAIENVATNTRNSICTMCSRPHMLYQCKQFGNQSPEERTEFVQSKRLCFNCLAHNHSVKFCRQSTCCRRCGRRHHSLLHLERKIESTPNESKEPNEQVTNEKETKISTHFAQETQGEILLATALVKIKSSNGYCQIVRALIDQGSEASFVNEATVQALGLKRSAVNGLISGVGDGKTRTKSMVSFVLGSRFNSLSIPVNAYVLSTLTSFLPNNSTLITDWPELENLSLADPQFGVPSKIDIILGVDILTKIILNGLKKHPGERSLIAQNTQLGWILSGRINNINQSNPRIINLHLQVKEDQLLAKFWEIERGPESIEKKITKEERSCEDFFEKTTTRDHNGRYMVKLPFKEENPQCFKGETRNIALRRFQLLEKKLKRDPDLYEKYVNVIEDYIIQGHMVEITEQKNSSKAVYLPHHAVVREDKETTKVRCVFDASCKGSNNVSLNDCFLIGPKLQQDLRHILMRWRKHTYCIVADIVQMYRQIRVHNDDTDCQRILWRSNSNQPIKCYKLVRLTFGTACAPYLAVKCLQQLAIDEQSKYPIAAKITLHDFYMDDLLSGSETEKESIEIYEQLKELMLAGGFHLQKWCTNSEKLLNHIKTDKQRSDQSVVFKENNMIKVLGICWNKDTDNFEYTLELPVSEMPITKRKVLSDIARLYDPLGWIAPVIITAKIYIQQLWKSGLAWDDDLSPELLKMWLDFRRDLINVKAIIIPRWLQVKRTDEVELHAFSDASQTAFAAAIYIKIKNESGYAIVHLITAKTRVAPVEKEVSIPRLELCAALLATQLMFEVSQVMSIARENLYAWSDSTVTLAWIRGEPSRWTTFVSNRVSEILTMLDRDKWNYVNTKHNPADCASRGLSAKELSNHKLWWYGPDWLKEINEYKISKPEDFVTTEEQRPIKAMTIEVRVEEDFLCTRFSSLQKMLRVLSYCKRVSLWKIPKELRVIPECITSEEMEKILELCVKETQNIYFKDDIQQLKLKGSTSKSSKLHTLCPIFDENGILRVGGRIMHSQESFDKKHSMILPATSHLTKLIILDAHIKTLHGGPLSMLHYLRSKFWILRAREHVKKSYRNCTVCIRYSRQQRNIFMGQLPSVRLKPERAFKSTGVDFTGYIKIRCAPGRGLKSYKGYICIFICMVTRAIHLEAVSNLSAEGFIAAFRRFVSRRGYCKDLYSDNGTNFIGADKELRAMFNKAVSDFPKEVSSLLANEGTTWHYIPPQAPNFGGLWEAGVRSTKGHLKRVIGETTLTYEELSTVLTQIEACLNSRPLSQLSDSPDDPLPLTPGHFLVGEPLTLIPDEDYSKKHVTGLQRWKLIQKMLNDFWKRWSDEYLVTLNQRFKWTMKRSEPENGDVVIIKDQNLPPAKWLLGVIVEKHTGKDNITRVVTVKTKNGYLKRPCNKLCFLPKSEILNDMDI
ncbi:uncharacterized protein LOC131854043 [Achroia grisella]|uniref:uncharacterized protein LOC131854043 n=1 Tax=Achroia grisella TaxID=688607 RepID=UPI0027D229C4|nr:uncharacterized protein LOC131854043 [Achroia grisella]